MKLLEHYTSIQGEGPNTGVPIQFIRFAGCNMRCPGWPCDTPQAIFPEQYKDEYWSADTNQILSVASKYPMHLCFTGGEPFLQTDFPQLIRESVLSGFKVDIFTNGSFHIPKHLGLTNDITIVMDWKLEGSGEADTKRDIRIQNVPHLGRNDAIKFVVRDMADLEEAHNVYENLNLWSFAGQVYVGAAWGHIKDEQIVDFVLREKLPWKLNIQTHKYIWDPEARYT